MILKEIENELKKIKEDIINDIDNVEFTNKGWLPLYTIGPKSKIIIIGQAPGIKAQESGIAWNDLSGDRLREWLGVSKAQFYDTDLFALIPMDFYYPGKGKSGDLPPRKTFSQKWHPKLKSQLKDLRLIILVGSYAQKYYLKNSFKQNLTETVKSFNEYLPEYFPIVHPSPLNIRWQSKNPWFKDEVIPILKAEVNKIINEKETD